MGFLDHSEDDEEEGSHGSEVRGARFGARRQKPRSKSHHQLLLMDSVGGGKAGLGGECASEEEEEIVPLPEYERLSQSARLPDDPDPKNPLPPHERGASLRPTPPPPRQQQKPAAWRLLKYVRSMNKSSVAAGGSWDGDSRSSDDGEKEGVDGDGDGGEEGRKDKDKQQQKKKRSSWLPDPDRRWPVQGFY